MPSIVARPLVLVAAAAGAVVGLAVLGDVGGGGPAAQESSAADARVVKAFLASVLEVTMNHILSSSFSGDERPRAKSTTTVTFFLISVSEGRLWRFSAARCVPGRRAGGRLLVLVAP